MVESLKFTSTLKFFQTLDRSLPRNSFWKSLQTKVSFKQILNVSLHQAFQITERKILLYWLIERGRQVFCSTSGISSNTLSGKGFCRQLIELWILETIIFEYPQSSQNETKWSSWVLLEIPCWTISEFNGRSSSNIKDILQPNRPFTYYIYTKLGFLHHILIIQSLNSNSKL